MIESIVFADLFGAMRYFQNDQTFWSHHAATLPAGYLISQYCFTESWPRWERHPQGDELVVIFSGAMTLIFERDDRNEELKLHAGQVAKIPKGQWHTADICDPVTALFITFSRDTEHKARHRP